MEIPDQLLCLFTGSIEARGGEYVIEVPNGEIEFGDVDPGEAYRVAILPLVGSSAEPRAEGGRERQVPEPPVNEGDVREVEIEDLGEQGDGIARIERGYIVFVPGTDIGDRVTIEITDVRENFAFSEVVDGDAEGPIDDSEFSPYGE